MIDESMRQALAGRTVLITGGSRTLGAAIVRMMAAAGARIALHYHTAADAARALAEELRHTGVDIACFAADLTDATAACALIDAVTQHFGSLDVLVNNVGPYVDTPFRELALADFDRVMAGNLRATFVLTQAAARQMAPGAIVINIAATDHRHRSHSVYGLAKAGVIHLGEAFARELAPDVRVYTIAPDLLAENEEMDATISGPAIAATPMGRLVRRDEVAWLACLLCTPAFVMATGHTITLDGARSIPVIAVGARAGG
jgi:3-oxoacyl-[acyl-carrier protein] reductase